MSYDMEKIPAHRSWRGVNDTLTDFVWWLRTWGKLLAFLLQSPVRTVQGLLYYDLAEAFLSVPAAVDNFVGNAKGASLTKKHREISEFFQNCLNCAHDIFTADGREVYAEGGCAEMIMHGSSGLKTVSVGAALPIFCADGKKLPDIGRCGVVSSEQRIKNIPPPVFVLAGGEGIIDAIRFVEKHTGEKFDWDVFREYLLEACGERAQSPADAVEIVKRYI